MQQILANPLGALAQADSLIRGQRQTRLTDLQLQAAEKRQQLGTLLPKAMTGDQQATSQVAEIDPELFLNLDKNRKEALRQQISENASMLAGVLNAPAPLRAAAYRQVRDIAIRERGATPESMPEMYDEGRIIAQIARARKVEDILKVQPGAGPEGKGAESWAIRTLLSGDPSSPEYAAAYNHYGRPKVQYTQTDAGLVPVTTPPNMSAFSQPGQRAAAQDFPGETPPPPPPVPGGQPSPIPGTAKSPSVEQGNASGFYARMLNSNKIIDDLESKGYSPSVKDFVTSGGKWTSALTSEQGQMYRQAQENWVRANLRKESGAAIPPGEMEDEIKNYFPVPGDKPATIKQKAQNRKVVTDAMRMAAGPGAKTVDSKFSDKIAAPQTQADYDALPSGAIFVDPDDGKQYRKP